VSQLDADLYAMRMIGLIEEVKKEEEIFVRISEMGKRQIKRIERDSKIHVKYVERLKKIDEIAKKHGKHKDL